MSGVKDFFMAGIMVEEAREARDAARERLREVAAVKCPDELRQLDATSEALETAERRMAEVYAAMQQGKVVEGMQRALAEHARTCDIPDCFLKTRGGGGDGGAN